MNDFVAGDLTIAVAPQPSAGVIRLDWRGRSNHRDPSAVLRPYMDTLLNEARERGATIEMHFEELEHFNSSTITVIIQLIRRLADYNVHLCVVYQAALRWQRLSFEALKVFERQGGLVELRAAAPPS